MQRIRPAVTLLSQEIGLDHALASRRVYTDGAEVIYDYARDSDDEALPTVMRTGQQHLADVIRAHLQPITYGGDGWVERMGLPAYTAANVVVDPHQAFGQPVVVEGGARVEDLVDRFQAGDSAAEIADDFGVPPEWLRDAGQRGWAVLMKDAKIRYRPTELDALETRRVRALVVTNARLLATEQAECIVSHSTEFSRQRKKPGPFIYGMRPECGRTAV
jgi:uncharacterized protein (DUF433 family)